MTAMNAMNSPGTGSVRLYNDVQGLAQLRADAAQEAPEAAREAARQFEALFVQMMLKSMRDASAALGDGSDSAYRDMFDQQIALEMTRGKGLGIAEVLMRQLQLQGLEDAGGAAAGTGLPSALVLARLATDPPRPSAGAAAGLLGELGPSATVPDLDAGAAPAVPALPEVAGAAGAGGREDFRPGSPAEFVRTVWPHAVAAGRELKVDPRAIVAQAALETGWGRRQIRDEAGVSGNNLFGIKADARWTGPRVTVQTLEYAGGVPVPQKARFRAYDTLAEGFADYVRFLKDNPRYGEALRGGAHPVRFAEGLEAAGYATDPRYAEKIRDILASPTLRGTVSALGPGSELPTLF